MKKPFLYILIFLSVLNSCSVYEPINIQVLKPASSALDTSVFRLVLINHGTYKKIFPPAVTNLDSIRTNEYFKGLNAILDYSPRFSTVKDSVYFYEKPGVAQRFEKMNWDTLQKLCTDSAADAALVLENYQITYTDPINISYSSDYGLYAKFEVENIALWRIYDPFNKRIVDEYLLQDTLIWDANGISQADISAQLPELNEALMQSCWYAGQKFGQRISPFWSTQKRYLLSCEVLDFQNALIYAQSDRWEQAIEIWKKYPYGKNKRLAAFASYNLAIASEAMDFLDVALEWASKSYLLRKNDYIKNYIGLLEKRKADKENLEPNNK